MTGAGDALTIKHSLSLPMTQECCLLAVDVFANSVVVVIVIVVYMSAIG